MAYATNEFLREFKDKMVRPYCEEHGIDFNSLSDDEKEEIVKEKTRQNTEKARKEEEEAERLKQEQAERAKKDAYIAWCNSTLPKRYRDAKKEDFRDTVAPLFEFKDSALILGGNGIGKSHLGWAIAKEAKRKGLSVEVINLYRLVSYIKKSEVWYSEIDQYASLDLLIIDEYDKTFSSDSDFILVSELIDQRYDEMLPTIVIGNGDEQQAQKLLGQSVYSRLTGDGGKLYKLGGADRRRNS